MNILIWSDIENQGPFQRQMPSGNIFSDIKYVKPVFSFTYSNLMYIEPNSTFIVDGSPMSVEQKAEVLAFIQAVEPPLDWHKAMKKREIDLAYEQTKLTISGPVDPAEMTTWTKQEAEARAYIIDPTTFTPIMDGLLVGRNLGESKLELAQKIIKNADAYTSVFSYTLGRYQARLKELDKATTVFTVEEVRW